MTLLPWKQEGRVCRYTVTKITTLQPEARWEAREHCYWTYSSYQSVHRPVAEVCLTTSQFHHHAGLIESEHYTQTNEELMLIIEDIHSKTGKVFWYETLNYCEKLYPISFCIQYHFASAHKRSIQWNTFLKWKIIFLDRPLQCMYAKCFQR